APPCRTPARRRRAPAASGASVRQSVWTRSLSLLAWPSLLSFPCFSSRRGPSWPGGHRVRQNVIRACGLGLRLVIDRPAQLGGRGVDPSHLHDFAEWSVLLGDPPLVERECIRPLEILGPRNVLARNMDPSHRH